MIAESLAVEADNAEILAHLQRIDSSLYLILMLVCCFIIWTAIKCLYKLFSMFFSF